jgi:hypothetical protein
MKGEEFRDNCAEGQLSPEGNELPVLACEFGPSDVPWNLFEAPIVCTFCRSFFLKNTLAFFYTKALVGTVCHEEKSHVEHPVSR